MITEKNGQQYEFWLDIRKAIDIEREQGLNILDVLDALNVSEGKNPSFLAIDNACKTILGMDLPSLVDAGFSLKEIVGEKGLILEVVKEADFFSGMSVGDTSADTTPEGVTQPYV